MITNLGSMAFSYCQTIISIIMDYKTALEKTNQIEYKSDLHKIRRSKKKLNGQKYTFYNIEMLYKTGNNVIKLFHNYFYQFGIGNFSEHCYFLLAEILILTDVDSLICL